MASIRVGLAALFVGLLVVGAASVVVGGGAGPIGDAVDDVLDGPADADGTPFAAENGTNTPAEGGADTTTVGRTPPADDEGDDEVDRAVLEGEIHRFINEERVERDLPPLEYDERLAAIARNHSRDMAERDYFSHTSQDGEDLSDRYADAGYDCRVSTGGTRYATGGENIASTYADTPVRQPNGSTVDHDSDETSLARGIVRGWMNSEGHRENLLREYWEHEGVGVTLASAEEGTRVYATQNFC